MLAILESKQSFHPIETEKKTHLTLIHFPKRHVTVRVVSKGRHMSWNVEMNICSCDGSGFCSITLLFDLSDAHFDFVKLRASRLFHSFTILICHFGLIGLFELNSVCVTLFCLKAFKTPVFKTKFQIQTWRHVCVWFWGNYLHHFRTNSFTSLSRHLSFETKKLNALSEKWLR